MTGMPGSGTILSHIESIGEMCIIMVWQKVKRGESLFAVLSNKTGRTHLENETGMFMRKKHMKAIALGMAAVMTVTPVCPAVYAVDTTAQTGTEVGDSMHNISGDLTVTTFFNEKTNAVLFQDGDTYKFRFHNTSNGQYNYENYVIGIIGTAMDAYTGFLDEVAILRADTWGWGGGMSDFVTPDGNGNQIQFNTNIEYENNVFESMMQEGADCEVILRRVGDTIIYSAKIGDYTASSQMTSGITLPEDCYIFFTGENCSLTGFETEYTRNNEQTSTDAPEQTDTDAWEETTTRKPDSGTGDEDTAQKVTDKISGDLTVGMLFDHKTDMVVLDEKSTYTFRFHNKSVGAECWDNFIAAIVGADPQNYTGMAQEILVLRADAFGWGGGMSDFLNPNNTYDNVLHFDTDITDVDAFEKEMQQGVDCEVTISRDKDILIYQAKIGNHTVELTAVSGQTLPEKCYLFFTGEECELTGFETEYSAESITADVLTVEDIPDKALYADILKAADRNGDGIIQKAEAENVYSLEIHGTFEDCTGLEYLTNLETVYFYMSIENTDKAITLLKKLSELKKLVALKLPYDFIADEEAMKIIYNMPLSSLSGLIVDNGELLCPEGAENMPLFQSISSLSVKVQKDFSFSKLSALKNLVSLSVDLVPDVQITDIDALNNLEKLESFYLGGNLSGIEITSDTLKYITNLSIYNYGSLDKKGTVDTKLLGNVSWLSISGMQLRGSFNDINNEVGYIEMNNCKLPGDATTVDLSKFTGLWDLSLNSMGLTEVTGLDKLENLQELSLADNKLTKIAGLDKLTKINYLTLSGNELSEVPALYKYPSFVYLQNNKITDISALGTLKNGNNVVILNLYGNQITSVKDANLVSLNALDDIHDLRLGGNRLTVDEVKGYVPEKCSADISWLANATSVQAAGQSNVYTWVNSELIASDIDERLGYIYSDSTLWLEYYTTAESVLIEDELLEYIRGLDREVSITINYVDAEHDIVTGGVKCEFTNVPEDVKEFTIYNKVVQLVPASEEIQNAFGTDCVYAGFNLENRNPSYVTVTDFYYISSYNVYAYDNSQLKRIAKQVSCSNIVKNIKNGTYPAEGYYYVPAAQDTYYNYTEETGKYTDPMKSQVAAMDNEAFLKAVESAAEGDEITVTVQQNNIMGEVWNAIIEKKLSVNLQHVNDEGEIIYRCHFNYADMKEIDKDNYITIEISSQSAEFNKPVSYYFNIFEYKMVEEGYYPGSQILDFKATLDLYVGINLANGESGYSLANSYYVLDKDMKKQLVYEAGDKTYLTNAGMITAEVTSGNTIAIIAKALADKEFEEAEIPEYSDDVVYRNGETIFEAAGKKNSSLNVKGTGNNLTIATNVELSTLYSNSQIVFTLESRKDGNTFVSLAQSGDTLLLGTSSGWHDFRNCLKEGTNEVTVNLVQSEDDGTHIIVLVGKQKVYEGDLKNMSLSDMDTFYNNDTGLNNNKLYYGFDSIANVKTKILAGTVLPADIVEDNVVRKTDEITGDYKIGEFFSEKTDAVELKSGDTYTFTFHNKSTGSNNWENYVMAVIGEIGYDYVDSSDEVLIVRADAWGWGGGKSDFMAPDFNTENSLVFTSNIDDWNAWNELMASGADCKVTLSRNGDTLVYTAVMGSYEVKCTAVSSCSLPESCYVFFTGENCELTGFKTVKEKQPEETTTEETTSKEEATSKEEETTTQKAEETTTKKEEATSTEEETTTKKAEETTTKKEEATSKEEETSTKKVEEESTTKKEDKVNKSEPVKVSDSKIVDSEKVLTTAVDKMKSTILKTIEVVSDKAQTLTKEVFDTIQKEGKNLTVGVTDEDNKLQYSWTFSNRTLTDTDMNIDLGIKFDTEKKEEIKKLTGREDAMYLSFAHHGELPGPATIKSYVGDNYQNGEKIYLYYFDEEQNKILMIGNTALEVKDGYVEYTITHCSTYFFMEEKLDGVEKDARSLDDASLSVTDEKAVLTINGTKVPTNESTAVTETTNTTKADNTTATTKQKAADIPATSDTADSVRYLVMMFAFAVITVLTGNAVKRNKNK